MWRNVSVWYDSCLHFGNNWQRTQKKGWSTRDVGAASQKMFVTRKNEQPLKPYLPRRNLPKK